MRSGHRAEHRRDAEREQHAVEAHDERRRAGRLAREPRTEPAMQHQRLEHE